MAVYSRSKASPELATGLAVNLARSVPFDSTGARSAALSACATACMGTCEGCGVKDILRKKLGRDPSPEELKQVLRENDQVQKDELIVRRREPARELLDKRKADPLLRKEFQDNLELKRADRLLERITRNLRETKVLKALLRPISPVEQRLTALEKEPAISKTQPIVLPQPNQINLANPERQVDRAPDKPTLPIDLVSPDKILADPSASVAPALAPNKTPIADPPAQPSAKASELSAPEKQNEKISEAPVAIVREAASRVEVEAKSELRVTASTRSAELPREAEEQRSVRRAEGPLVAKPEVVTENREIAHRTSAPTGVQASTAPEKKNLPAKELRELGHSEAAMKQTSSGENGTHSQAAVKAVEQAKPATLAPGKVVRQLEPRPHLSAERNALQVGQVAAPRHHLQRAVFPNAVAARVAHTAHTGLISNQSVATGTVRQAQQRGGKVLGGGVALRGAASQNVVRRTLRSLLAQQRVRTNVAQRLAERFQKRAQIALRPKLGQRRIETVTAKRGSSVERRAANQSTAIKRGQQLRGSPTVLARRHRLQLSARREVGAEMRRGLEAKRGRSEPVAQRLTRQLSRNLTKPISRPRAPRVKENSTRISRPIQKAERVVRVAVRPTRMARRTLQAEPRRRVNSTRHEQPRERRGTQLLLKNRLETARERQTLRRWAALLSVLLDSQGIAAQRFEQLMELIDDELGLASGGSVAGRRRNRRWLVSERLKGKRRKQNQYQSGAGLQLEEQGLSRRGKKRRSGNKAPEGFARVTKNAKTSQMIVSASAAPSKSLDVVQSKEDDDGAASS